MQIIAYFSAKSQQQKVSAKESTPEKEVENG
jgi:hypothetical protein